MLFLIPPLLTYLRCASLAEWTPMHESCGVDERSAVGTTPVAGSYGRRTRASIAREGCILVCSPLSLPKEACRPLPRFYPTGRCSLFLLTDFIRNFRAGGTHGCEGGGLIRTVPPLRVSRDIAGQALWSAPPRRRRAVFWREHPHTYGVTTNFLVAAVQGLCRPLPGDSPPRPSSVGPGSEGSGASRSWPGSGARGCAASRVCVVTRGCQAPGDPLRPAGTIHSRRGRVR